MPSKTAPSVRSPSVTAPSRTSPSRTSAIIVASVLVLLGGCGSGSAGDASGTGAGTPGRDETPAGASEGTSTGAAVDPVVANAVAPYDYESALDEIYVGHVLDEQIEAYLSNCVTRLGGVSSYEPVPPADRESITDEMIGDYPNLDLLAERGRTLHFDPPHPEIRREDYATEDEYASALFAAEASRVRTDDERALEDDCTSDPGYAEVGDPYELYYDVWNSWLLVQQEIEHDGEINELRDEFRDCVVAGGMAPDPQLNDRTFWAYVDGELSHLDGSEAMIAHNVERGKLFAECGQELYEVKERLRAEAHDAFVEEHEEDIARLSDHLYGDGLLDPPG
jgi:hypothetical protein